MENDTCKVELLAPAGSMEALKAALANGADAVYLGAASFGARATAGFDGDELHSAISLCHLYHRRVHVTVNTLVKESELPQVRDTLRALNSLHPDAVLVQDLGVLSLCREEFPGLKVHLSTQMALHNVSGALLAKKMGASRVVLARECSLEDIRAVARTGIETEVFVHGALCVCVSGQCLFSSMIGGRSGNRGRCAQPCRLQYTYEGQNGAWLSPRDICLRDQLPQLIETGVKSLKIEGRLKRPEYVAVVTRAYRKALDAALEGRFTLSDAKEKQALRQIFSRGGFSAGYPMGNEDAAIIDPSRVSPEGILMGQASPSYRKGGALLCDVPLTETLHNGDGLEVGAQSIIYSGPERLRGEIATLRLREKCLAGEQVRRIQDEAQLSAARETYTEKAIEENFSIPFDAEISVYPGKNASLTVSDGRTSAAETGAVAQKAQMKPLDAQTLMRSIEKTGGTPFRLGKLVCHTAEAYLSAAELNALRRGALEKLKEKRVEAFENPEPSAPMRFPPIPNIPWTPQLYVSTQQAEEIPRLFALGADRVIFAPQDYRMEQLTPLVEKLPQKVYLQMPLACDDDTLEKINTLVNRVSCPAALSSPGQLACHWSAGAISLGGIPVYNHRTVALLSALGCSGAVLSSELSREETLALDLNCIELIQPVYGRMRLMTLTHCPMRTYLGLQKGKAACRLCDMSKGTQGTCLTDRMGAAFPLAPVRFARGCRVNLMSALPMNLLSDITKEERIPFSMYAALTDESAAQREEVLTAYRSVLDGKAGRALSVSGTPGRYREGVL